LLVDFRSFDHSKQLPLVTRVPMSTYHFFRYSFVRE
jgi:hypothetical protein